MRFILIFVFLLPLILQAIEIEIHRNMSCSDESVIGILYIDNKEFGRTLELPWKNNEPLISQIPKRKTYKAKMRSDGKLGWRIELIDVPDRKNIQIHVGNYKKQTQGCILAGLDVPDDGKCMVTNSTEALTRIRQYIEANAQDEFQKMMYGEIDIKVTVVK